MSKKWCGSSGSRDGKEPSSKYKRQLKNWLFKKNGWREKVEVAPNVLKWDWFAYCAFDCGTILWMDVATLDHYPIPQRLGGEWTLSNLRLACCPCNSSDKHNRVAGVASLWMPVGLSRKERVAYFLKLEKHSKEMNAMHGIPLDLL